MNLQIVYKLIFIKSKYKKTEKKWLHKYLLPL